MKIRANKKGKAFMALTAAIAAAAAGYVIQRTETPEIYYDGNEFHEMTLLSEISTDEEIEQITSETPPPSGKNQTASAAEVQAVPAQETQIVLPEENADIPDNTQNTSLININTASAKELQSLKGIGEKLSQRIVEYRTLNGNFDTIEDIMKVSGIGSKTFENIKMEITV